MSSFSCKNSKKTEQKPPMTLPLLHPPTYEVESIVAAIQTHSKKKFYLIRWAGTDEQSWEPEKNLVECDESIRDFEESSLVLRFKYNRSKREWSSVHKTRKRTKRGRDSDDSYEGSSGSDEYMDDYE